MCELRAVQYSSSRQGRGVLLSDSDFRPVMLGYSIVPRPIFKLTWGVGLSLGARPLKNRKGGSGTSAGVEVYTAEC